MEIIYQDQDLVVCVKPARILSTDEPGGLPELLRRELGTEDFRTVHRLDRVVSGLMVVARNAAAASELSRQIREDFFEKEYLAVVHGRPEEAEGRPFSYLFCCSSQIRSTAMSEGLTPEIRPACPMDMGRISLSFSRASRRRPTMVL